MCCSIKIVFFGCPGGEEHAEYAVVRCKGGLEYMLLLPVGETCKGIKSVEDWRMTACRFCTDYLESRKSSGLLGGHFRAMSLPVNAFTAADGPCDASEFDWHSFARCSQ